MPARLAGWLIGVVALLGLAILGLMVGAKEFPAATVWEALTAFDDSDDHLIVIQMRLPRTLLAMAVGAALAVSGSLLQGLTRNPLADPGVLGANAGAAFAVAVSVGIAGVHEQRSIAAIAVLGAATATLVVFLIGRAQSGRAGTVGLVLAGVAIGAMFSGGTSTIMLTNAHAFDQMRDWNAGSLSGRGYEVLGASLPFLIVGVVLALAMSRSLDAVTLGDDHARALGVNLARTRTLTVFSATLLCGAATAAVGPIGFVGLMVPHAVRWLTGPGQRWVLAYALVWGPALVLLADIVGRVVLRPAELPVGVVTAFIGAPVLVYLARRRRAAAP